MDMHAHPAANRADEEDLGGYSLFYLSGGLLILSAITGWILSLRLLSSSGGAQALGVGFSTLLLPVGLYFLVWPVLIRSRLRAFYRFPAAMSEVNSRLVDLQQFKRELNKPLTALEALHQQVQGETEAFQQIVSDKAALDRQIQQIEDQLVQERQEKGNLRRELDDWRNTAIDFFRTYERILNNEGMSEENRDFVERLVVTFSQSVAPRGLDLIRPFANHPFDDRVHQAVGQESSGGTVSPGHVLGCTAWGFRSGSTVLRPAEVVLAGPEPSSAESYGGHGGETHMGIEILGEMSPNTMPPHPAPTPDAAPPQGVAHIDPSTPETHAHG